MKSKTIHRLKILVLSCFLSYSFFVRGAAKAKQIKQKKASSELALSNKASFFFNSETGCYACTNCDKEWKKKSHIQSHLYVHAIGKLYKCDHVYADGSRCTKRTKRPDGIIRHKNETHSDLRSHKCHQCLIKFKRSEHLQTHLKTIHSIVKEDPNGDELEKPEEESPLEEAIHAEDTEEKHDSGFVIERLEIPKPLHVPSPQKQSFDPSLSPANTYVPLSLDDLEKMLFD